MIVYTSRNEALTLADKAMSSGGEGEIHTVLSKPSRFDNVCVKIYYRTKRNVQLEKKLRYMSANPPKQISLEGILIAWPQEVVYDQQKNFLGFVMPLAFSNSQKLAVLTSKKLYKNLTPEWAGKFDRQLGGASIAARLRLICNIAISVHLLHSTGKYVLRDFKPDNVLVTYEGKVALVDMDSLQIAEENNRFLPKMLFPANTGGTPDYMPPEYYNRKVGKNAIIPIAKTWDYFSIAVVFYQILFGLHPYMVTPRVEKDSESNELYPNIAQNLFPFGANAAKISSYPSLHLNFKRIPSKLQDLFVRAFSDDTSIRPTPEEWVKTIKEIIRKAPKVSPNLHSDEAKQMADTFFFEQNQSTKKGLKRYLNRFPEGLHAQQAKDLLLSRKRDRNLVFILLFVCSVLMAIIFYDMIRRGDNHEKDWDPDPVVAVDSAVVDSAVVDSVVADSAVADISYLKVDGNTSDRTTQSTEKKSSRSKCERCKGRGFIKCEHCTNGKVYCTSRFERVKSHTLYTFEEWIRDPKAGDKEIHGRESYNQSGRRVVEVCPSCKGTFWIDCRYCEGIGKRQCSLCKGIGKVN